MGHMGIYGPSKYLATYFVILTNTTITIKVMTALLESINLVPDYSIGTYKEVSPVEVEP